MNSAFRKIYVFTLVYTLPVLFVDGMKEERSMLKCNFVYTVEILCV